MDDNDSNQFNVNLKNFKGPLDTLLDLARSQKVNLENISVTLLADQFLEFITNEKNICNNGLINFPINININETGPINLSFNTYHIKINDNKPTKEYNVRFDGLQRDLRF